MDVAYFGKKSTMGDPFFPFTTFIAFILASSTIFLLCCCLSSCLKHFCSNRDHTNVEIITPPSSPSGAWAYANPALEAGASDPNLAARSASTNRQGPPSGWTRFQRRFLFLPTYEAPPPAYEDVIKQPPPYAALSQGVSNPACL